MNTARFLSVFSMTLIAAVLTACGGGASESALPSAQSASLQSAAVTRVVDLSVDPASVGQTPAPDCAAEHCQGLRIIDGNAEAVRIDAMRRAGQG
ncbi:hypothetical protein [Massilia suwonensis]|uniref:Uncharacterized protein n=1 Tax=Massilia suwonensis TaxID=648895 RepID=A0ABW0MTT3_9BURK